MKSKNILICRKNKKYNDKKLLDYNLIFVAFVSPPDNIWTTSQKEENWKEIQNVGGDWLKT